MDISCSNTGVNFADVAIALMVGWAIWFVFHQFKIGESSGKGGWVKKSEHPGRFKFLMSAWILLAIVFTLVAIMDVYARVNHLPRCG